MEAVLARPALDPLIQAMSGIMQLTGSDETGPLRTGFPFSNLVTPLFATIGVLAVLRVRERTGRGQRVDLSMLDAAIFGMMPREAYFFATGRPPSRLGNEHYQMAPWNTYETADSRYLIAVARTEKFWHALITALDAPELGADPRFLSKRRPRPERHGAQRPARRSVPHRVPRRVDAAAHRYRRALRARA